MVFARLGPIPSLRTQDSAFSAIAARAGPLCTSSIPYDSELVIRACARGFCAELMVYHLVAAALHRVPRAKSIDICDSLRPLGEFLDANRTVNVDYDYLGRGPASSLVSGSHDPETVCRLMRLLVSRGAMAHLNSNRLIAGIRHRLIGLAIVPRDRESIRSMEYILHLERLVDPRVAAVHEFLTRKPFPSMIQQTRALNRVLRGRGSLLNDIFLIGKLAGAGCYLFVSDARMHQALRTALDGELGAAWRSPDTVDAQDNFFAAAVSAERSELGQAIAAFRVTRGD